MTAKTIAIILAAGEGTRFQSPVPKQFTYVEEETILEKSLRVFTLSERFTHVILVTSENHKKYLANLQSSASLDTRILSVSGGKTRGESIINAFLWIFENLGSSERDRFIVHDSCRPFLSSALLNLILDSSSEEDAWVTFQTPGDTFARRNPEGKLEILQEKENLFALNTPIRLSERVARRITSSSPLDFESGLAGYLISHHFKIEYIKSDGSTRKITFQSDLDF